MDTDFSFPPVEPLSQTAEIEQRQAAERAQAQREVEARQAAERAERAERERIDRARQQRHLDAIDAIASCEDAARGLPADSIEAVMASVRGLDVSAAVFEEFAGRAGKQQHVVIERLGVMLATARDYARDQAQRAEQAAERAAAEATRQASAVPTFAAPALTATLEAPALAQTPARPARVLRLGEIAAALGFAVSGDLLADLGFQPANTDRGAKLYRGEDFVPICRALIARIEAAAAAFEAAP